MNNETLTIDKAIEIINQIIEEWHNEKKKYKLCDSHDKFSKPCQSDSTYEIIDAITIPLNEYTTIRISCDKCNSSTTVGISDDYIKSYLK